MGDGGGGGGGSEAGLGNKLIVGHCICKEPAFSVINLFYCFLSFCFTYFFTDFYCLFPPTNLMFCVFFFLLLL